MSRAQAPNAECPASQPSSAVKSEACPRRARSMAVLKMIRRNSVLIVTFLSHFSCCLLSVLRFGSGCSGFHLDSLRPWQRLQAPQRTSLHHFIIAVRCRLMGSGPFAGVHFDHLDFLVSTHQRAECAASPTRFVKESDKDSLEPKCPPHISYVRATNKDAATCIRKDSLKRLFSVSRLKANCKPIQHADQP